MTVAWLLMRGPTRSRRCFDQTRNGGRVLADSEGLLVSHPVLSGSGSLSVKGRRLTHWTTRRPSGSSRS